MFDVHQFFLRLDWMPAARALILNYTKLARFLAALRSAHSQKTPWIFDQNGIYLFLPEAPGPHHGNDVSEYVTVPLAAVTPEPGQVANVLGDEYLPQMAPIDEDLDDRQTAGVIEHVNRCKRIEP